MLAAEIIAKIIKTGGRIWLEKDKVRARLPESLRPMVSLIQSQKQELIVELIRRPAVPFGIQLNCWELKDPPVQLSRFETVTDVELFV